MIAIRSNQISSSFLTSNIWFGRIRELKEQSELSLKICKNNLTLLQKSLNLLR